MLQLVFSLVFSLAVPTENYIFPNIELHIDVGKLLLFHYFNQYLIVILN